MLVLVELSTSASRVRREETNSEGGSGGDASASSSSNTDFINNLSQMFGNVPMSPQDFMKPFLSFINRNGSQ
ncbi:unnamed protein product [Leptidea sinapis]|uniref:Uncharacterized protein n=1 Tax=Leptidea sinapis TaxID=189913 RepID=A0A5E4QVS8_9NEOP|nr:unnamed protein product [Leptidea sinapis]